MEGSAGIFEDLNLEAVRDWLSCDTLSCEWELVRSYTQMPGARPLLPRQRRLLNTLLRHRLDANFVLKSVFLS
jgi:hypothetical protein